MQREEFIRRVKFEVMPKEYDSIEKLYMNEIYGKNLDKDEFCKMWLEKGGIREILQSRADGNIELPPIKRYKSDELFMLIVDGIKKSGEFEKAEKILDYYLPNVNESNTEESGLLTDYRFNFNAVADFGGNEGIYLNCYLKGTFDDSGKNVLDIGTFKTLKDDLESMKTMAELGGIINYRLTEFVNRNIECFTKNEERMSIAQKQAQMDLKKLEETETREVNMAEIKIGGEYRLNPEETTIYKVLDIDGDKILLHRELDKSNETVDPTPYIIATFPEVINENLSWGMGNYKSTYKDALYEFRGIADMEEQLNNLYENPEISDIIDDDSRNERIQEYNERIESLKGIINKYHNDVENVEAKSINTREGQGNALLDENIQIFMRLGTTLNLPKAQALKVLSGDRKALLDTLLSPNETNGTWLIDGDTYIPQPIVENLGDEYSRFADGDIDFLLPSIQGSLYYGDNEKSDNNLSTIYKVLSSNDKELKDFVEVFGKEPIQTSAYDELFTEADNLGSVWFVDSDRISNWHFNPDSEVGGTLVESVIYTSELSEIIKESTNDFGTVEVDTFFDLINERCEQYNTDIDSDGFKSVLESIKADIEDNSRISIVDEPEETMNSLISIVEKKHEETFLDFLRSDTKHGKKLEYGDFLFDGDVTVGGVDMSHALVWIVGNDITDYCYNQYSDLLNSPYKLHNDSYIEILCDNYKNGESFFAAAAGYISNNEYKKMFTEIDDNFDNENDDEAEM